MRCKGFSNELSDDIHPWVLKQPNSQLHAQQDYAHLCLPPIKLILHNYKIMHPQPPSLVVNGTYYPYCGAIVYSSGSAAGATGHVTSAFMAELWTLDREFLLGLGVG